MTLADQLNVAQAYTSQVGGPVEIDKEKGIVFVVDHETKEWTPVAAILGKYFVKEGE